MFEGGNKVKSGIVRRYHLMEGVEEAEDEAPRRRGRGGVKGLCGAVRFCMEGKIGGWQDGFCFEVGRGVLLQ